MSPTLHTAQLIFIVKIAYTPSRGDIIVFDSPDGLELVKRVIGLPGETVEITDGIVYINNEELEQEYQYPTQFLESMPATTISEDSIFVLGDYRDPMLRKLKIDSVII